MKTQEKTIIAFHIGRGGEDEETESEE